MGQISLGIHSGFIRTELNGDRTKNVFDFSYHPKRSFQAGGIIDIGIKKDVAISIQPNYRLFRAFIKIRNEDFIEDLDIGDLDPENLPEEILLLLTPFLDYGDLAIHQLSVPILLKVISDNQKWHFYAGLDATMPINAKLKLVDNGGTLEVSDWLEDIVLSSQVGLGYKFRLLKNHFSIDLLYSQGLTNVFDANQSASSFPARVKMSTREFRLYWMLPTKSKDK